MCCKSGNHEIFVVPPCTTCAEHFSDHPVLSSWTRTLLNIPVNSSLICMKIPLFFKVYSSCAELERLFHRVLSAYIRNRALKVLLRMCAQRWYHEISWYHLAQHASSNFSEATCSNASWTRTSVKQFSAMLIRWKYTFFKCIHRVQS